MPIWLIALLATAFVVWGMFKSLGYMMATISESSARIEERLGWLAESTDKLRYEISALKRLLKPIASVAESRLEEIGWGRLAELSRKMDEAIKAGEREEWERQQRELEEDRSEEAWKKSDQERQVQVREDKKRLRGELEKARDSQDRK